MPGCYLIWTGRASPLSPPEAGWSGFAVKVWSSTAGNTGSPFLGPDDPAPPADLVMVAVKYHDLDDAIRDMKRRVGAETVIMSVMNGIDSEERIGAAYGMGRMLYAVSVGIDACGSETMSPTPTRGRSILARRPIPLSGRVRQVQSLIRKSGDCL